MKRIIFVLILLFFLSCSQSRKRTTSTTTIQEDVLNASAFKTNFIPIIDDFIDSLEQIISTNIIAVFCYSIDESEYITLMTVEGYSSDFLQGHTIYRDFLVYYSGVDSLIADKIFDFEELSINTPNKNYVNIKNVNVGTTIFDPIGEFYIINRDKSINRFKPTSKFEKELRKLEIEYGFSPPIPPSPK